MKNWGIKDKGVIKVSATNRGSNRHESDFYATPMIAIDNLLSHHILKEGNILEPCAGNGNIIRCLRLCGYTNHISAVEVRDEEIHSLKNNGASEVYIGDFLEYKPMRRYKTIITNPPYSIAQNTIEKCFEIADEDTEIIMLLRLAFLESKKRHLWWQKYSVNKLYILSDRPSFTGKGTDATAYAWFVWDGSKRQEIKVI